MKTIEIHHQITINHHKHHNLNTSKPPINITKPAFVPPMSPSPGLGRRVAPGGERWRIPWAPPSVGSPGPLQLSRRPGAPEPAWFSVSGGDQQRWHRKITRVDLIYGLCMVYIWFTYGLYMVYIWFNLYMDESSNPKLKWWLFLLGNQWSMVVFHWTWCIEKSKYV